MKVGTDGVILGAWAPHPQPRSILDVGTGTGLIALMLAQRFAEAMITAIEPDPEAAADAAENFEREPLGRHITLHRIGLEGFAPTHPYDLIVSNPPFFQNSMPSPDGGRNTARHAGHFGPAQFLTMAEWLSEGGVLAGIYPMDAFATVKKKALTLNLHLVDAMEVAPTPDKPAHRTLFAYSREPLSYKAASGSPLIIETGRRHGYSDAYRALTSPFYLDKVFERSTK